MWEVGGPVATLRAMKTLKRSAVSVSVAATVLALAAGPVHATESGGAGAGSVGEGTEKIQLPDRPRDQVGLILIGLGGLAGVAALENARRQLKGSRRQATGEWRWR